MKLVSSFLAISYSLCVACCGGVDDDFYNYNTTEISNDNLIQIENNQHVFNVDDAIIVSTIIENQQTTINNNSIFITDYINDDVPNNSLYYYLSLYRLNSNGTVSFYGLTNENLVVSDNSASIDNEGLFVTVNFEVNRFISNFELRISEPGTYYLSGVQYYYNNFLGKVQIIPTNGMNGNLIINSKIIDSNDDDRYVLTIE